MLVDLILDETPRDDAETEKGEQKIYDIVVAFVRASCSVDLRTALVGPVDAVYPACDYGKQDDHAAARVFSHRDGVDVVRNGIVPVKSVYPEGDDREEDA